MIQHLEDILGISERRSLNTANNAFRNFVKSADFARPRATFCAGHVDENKGPQNTIDLCEYNPGSIFRVNTMQYSECVVFGNARVGYRPYCTFIVGGNRNEDNRLLDLFEVGIKWDGVFWVPNTAIPKFPPNGFEYRLLDTANLGCVPVLGIHNDLGLSVCISAEDLNNAPPTYTHSLDVMSLGHNVDGPTNNDGLPNDYLRGEDLIPEFVRS